MPIPQSAEATNLEALKREAMLEEYCVNARKNYRSPIIYAVEHKDMVMLHALLDSKKVTINDKFGNSDWSPLEWACEFNDVDSANMFLELGAEKTPRALLIAVKNKMTEIADKLLAANVCADATYYKDTTLICAIRNGDLPTVTKLIDHGANVNFSSDYYPTKTPIFFAVDYLQSDFNKGFEIINTLREHGSNLNAKCREYSGVENKNYDVTVALYFLSCLYEMRNKHSITQADRDFVESLLKTGSNPNENKYYGNTCLQYAAAIGDHDLCKLLISHGAKSYVKNGANKLPSDFAKGSNKIYLRLMEYIEKRSAKSDFQSVIPKTLTIFGHKINISKNEKIAAAKALLGIVETKANLSTLDHQYDDALNNGDLGKIYAEYKKMLTPGSVQPKVMTSNCCM